MHADLQGQTYGETLWDKMAKHTEKYIEEVAPESGL